MGFWNTVKQVKYERQGGVRSQYGITRSSDSDVRCVECKNVSGYGGSSTRDCGLHRIEVDANDVCTRFSAS